MGGGEGRTVVVEEMERAGEAVAEELWWCF
jgi:hypothetical protein